MKKRESSTGKTGNYLAIISVLLMLTGAVKAYAVEVAFGLLRQPVETTTAVPEYLAEPENNGESGAELAVSDANGTGKFLGQKYSIHTQTSDDPAAINAAAKAWYDTGMRFFLADLDTPLLQGLRKALPDDALIFNVGNQDDARRTTVCLPNTLHTALSYGMRADALGQWLRVRRLTEVFLVSGITDADAKFLAATKSSLRKFNQKIIKEKVWNFDTDLRRTASAELPLFTQASDYDAVWVIDESNLFGQHLPYNTWLPRPVIGTHGLRADGWSYVIEQWGAVQLQNRFTKKFDRPMTTKDFAAWVAVRSVNEAVTVLNSGDVNTVLPFIMSDKFQLAAYKGRKLTFRPWNGQLRQTVPLFDAQALVASAPFDGFLHPRNELDSLGVDEAQSECRQF
ncbi:ABC transporter substrate-binding protein [Enterovibrio paralichthyis]|uniref:ABC transporter substrate-binding protein n=1 Tax=Enterovibrio paralichthyis TaxID=2853805 RepID=UPI001C4697FF|nr:ABC transporter substrate-binding protein [Enterovibrio paralichthyis]MBV7298919.1 branched-chain amino acid ABC transporter substrate-binding protein [Enterovibrio paralichthyis]